jgi:hypothetical protein
MTFKYVPVQEVSKMKSNLNDEEMRNGPERYEETQPSTSMK